MIEVFKTDVADSTHAGVLVDLIQDAFPHYRANFDLQDCDRILRVVSTGGPVQAKPLIQLLHTYGYRAELLADEVPPPPLEYLSSTELTPLGAFWPGSREQGAGTRD